MLLVPMIIRFLIAIFFLMPALVSASEIVLKSGQKIEGKIIERTDKYVKFDSGVGVVMTYYLDEIDTIDGNKLQIVANSNSRQTKSPSGLIRTIPPSVTQNVGTSESILKPCVTGMSAEQCEFSRLYDLDKQLHKVNGQGTDFVHQYGLQKDVYFGTVFINDDLMYILYRNKQVIYLFTPYYAEEIDLSRDAEGNKVCQGADVQYVYNLKVPYSPDDPAKQSGNYLLTLYVYNNNSISPYLKKYVSPCGLKIDTPEFYPTNSVITAPKGKNIPLVFEKMFWNKNANANSLSDAKKVLLKDIETQIKTMPAEEKEGDIWVICPGMGCYRPISLQRATNFNKNRLDALQYSKAVADYYNLYGDILSKADIDSKLKESSQPKVFRIEFDKIDHGYTRDDNHVYYFGRIVEGVDPKSFQRIGRTSYFKDVNHVYLGIKIISEADVSTFSPLDPDNIYNYLAHDNKHVFYEGTEVPGADPQNVKELGRDYWISNQTVYEGTKPIKQADPATFRYGGPNEVRFTAEDKNNYYWNDTAYKKSDCHQVGTVSICKDYIVSFNNRYSQIDVLSLRYLGKFHSVACGALDAFSKIYQDKNGFYAAYGMGEIAKLNLPANEDFKTLEDIEGKFCSGFPQKNAIEELIPEHDEQTK